MSFRVGAIRPNAEFCSAQDDDSDDFRRRRMAEVKNGASVTIQNMLIR